MSVSPSQMPHFTGFMGMSDTKVRHQVRHNPEAPARLVRNEGIYQWVVIKCPHCGKAHRHGGGLIKENAPHQYLGHRVAHCGRGVGYLLVEEVHTHM